MRDGMTWKIIRESQVATMTLRRRWWRSWQVDAVFTSLKDNGPFPMGWVHPVFATSARRAVARATMEVLNHPGPPDSFDG